MALSWAAIPLIAITLVGAGHAEARQLRSTIERHAFVKAIPCPATGRARLPCLGYQIDHVVPLCMGGADHRSNMQWLSIADHKAKTKNDVRTCRTR